MRSIEVCARKVWEDFERRGHFKHGILVVDDSMAEAIAWIGGAEWILSMGLTNIVTLSTIQDIVSSHSTTKLQREREIVDVVASNEFEEVLVLCSVTEEQHTIELHAHGHEEMFTFVECSKQIQLKAVAEYAERSPSKGGEALNTFVDVVHFPVHLCPVFGPSANGLHGCFLLSSKECQDAFPVMLSDYVPSGTNRRDRFDLVNSGMDAMLSDTVGDAPSSKSDDSAVTPSNVWNVNVSDIASNKRRTLVRVAHELAGCLRELGLRVAETNAFALGHSSELVGNKLMSIVANERARAASDESTSASRSPLPCSLILIDRTLDIVAPTQHGVHVVDDATRRVHGDERKPAVKCDRSFLCHGGNRNARTTLRQLFMHGDASDEKRSSTVEKTFARMERLLTRHPRDGNVDKTTCSSNVTRIRALLDPDTRTLKTNRGKKEWARRLDSLGLLERVVDPRTSSEDVEKELGMMERMQRELGCATEDPLLQLADLLRRPSGVVPILEILTLALHTFSLFGTKQLRLTSIRMFEDALCDAILRSRGDDVVGSLERVGFVDPEILVALQRLGANAEPSKDLERRLRRRVVRVVRRLVETGNVRNQLEEGQFASLQSARVSCGYRPLTKQLFETLLSPTRPDLTAVKRVGTAMQHLASGVSDIVGAAFSTFGWGAVPSKPRPTDKSVLVVFFVGGTTGFEIAAIDAAVHEYNKDDDPVYGPMKVIVGATNFASGRSVYDNILGGSYENNNGIDTDDD